MEEKAKDENIVMYGHPACPAVVPVISILKQAKAEYEYINIFEDNEARQKVIEINNGFQSVPTLLFPDGTTLTEPSTGELSKKLKSMGYEVPMTAMITGNFWLIVMVAAIIFAVLRGFGIF
jgi:mycoredoxin